MKIRRFGKTNLLLSIFSLGTMRFASLEEAYQTVAAAIAQGINHLETAPAYGSSERYLGEVLATLAAHHEPILREQLVITSKLAPSLAADSKIVADPKLIADRVDQAIDESLARLGTDYLDCLAIHGINTAEHLTWVNSALLKGIDRAKADGRVRHIGFSTHGSLDVILAAIATQSFSFINLHYNYFFQRNAPAIAQAHQQDMGIFIISPADKAGMLYTPPERLKSLCAPYDPLLLNYRWLLSDPRITTLSVGSATPNELAWPLQVADRDGALSEGEQSAIDRLNQAQVDSLSNNSSADFSTDASIKSSAFFDQGHSQHCTQCHKCLPCPESINIPEILRLRNLAVAYDMQAFGQYRYGMFENAGHWFPGRKGDRCTDCGDCLPRCPETLNIPALLRDTHQRLNGKKRRRLWEE